MSPGAETTKEGSLKIGQLKVSDSGTYKCIASNHVGSSEALTKVTVKGEQNMCPREIRFVISSSFDYELFT